ncbi:MAG: Crp/Fnr family transcriptional regulator [Chloroflexota bacterium]|nr:Crp/Fnr family transcriptional regulator [Chloroflexota bacterium]
MDPDLGYKLDEESLLIARRYAVAEVAVLPAGAWAPPAEGEHDGHLGYLVLEGLLQRAAQLANSDCAEVLGQGDVLRPWQEDISWAVAHYHVQWHVFEPTRVAILDRRFAAVACRWPEIIEVVMARCTSRARSLAFSLAISHLTRVDVRILAMLWHLADRWGRVTPEGIVVPLALTHKDLACLVGARRPSVTTALGELAHSHLVSRQTDGTWLLHGEPPKDLHHIQPSHERVATAAES